LKLQRQTNIETEVAEIRTYISKERYV